MYIFLKHLFNQVLGISFVSEPECMAGTLTCWDNKWNRPIQCIDQLQLQRLSLNHDTVAYMCGGDILVWQYKMVMTSLYIVICEIMFACVHMLKQFALSPIPCFAMASSLLARFGSAWFCQQNPWHGSAPARRRLDATRTREPLSGVVRKSIIFWSFF